VKFLVHQLGFAKRGICAWRVICDWSFEIALGDCQARGDIPLKHEFWITNWIVHKFLVGHNFAWNLSNPNFFPKSISLTFKPTMAIKFHCANFTVPMSLPKIWHVTQTVPLWHYSVNNFNTVCQKDSIECDFTKIRTKLNK